MAKSISYGLIDRGINPVLAIFFHFSFPKGTKNKRKEGLNSANCPAKANQL
jgi:hypothetical protein